MSLPRLVRASRDHVREAGPSLVLSEIVLRLADGREMTVPVGAAADDGKPWQPRTQAQADVLEALDGRSYPTVAALAAAVGCSVTTLYDQGLAELYDRGLVVKDPRIGYMRPDAPPAARVAGKVG